MGHGRAIINRRFRHSNRYLPKISQNLSVRDTEALVKPSLKSKPANQSKGIVSI
jgi:hypothetical protein